MDFDEIDTVGIRDESKKIPLVEMSKRQLDELNNLALMNAKAKKVEKKTSGSLWKKFSELTFNKQKLVEISSQFKKFCE